MSQLKIKKGQSLTIALSSGLSAISAFVISILAAHYLTEDEFRQFQTVFWPITFGIYGLTGAINQETTRSVRSAALDKITHKKRFSYATVATLIGAGISVLLALSSISWLQKLNFHPISSLIFICCGVILYATYSSVSGATAGRGEWYLFAAINAAEALLRMVMVVIFVLLSFGLLSLELAVSIASLCWIPFILFFSTGRNIWKSPLDVPYKKYTTNIITMMFSSLGSSILLTAFPFFLYLSTRDESPEMNALVAAISITRSPIMIPLQAFQGVAISHFLERQGKPIKSLLKPFSFLLGVGLIGAFLAYMIGPTLFNIFYPKYAGFISGSTLALLTFNSSIIALLVITGNLAIALSRHKLYTLGWIIAATVALLMLQIPLETTPLTILVLFLAPTAGALFHVYGISRN